MNVTENFLNKYCSGLAGAPTSTSCLYLLEVLRTGQVQNLQLRASTSRWQASLSPVAFVLANTVATGAVATLATTTSSSCLPVEETSKTTPQAGIL